MDKKQIFTIPNILSFVRILLIPFILWTIFIKYYYVATGLIVLSGITDILDGYIARRYNMTSQFGKIIDPVADKLTLLLITVALCFLSKVVIVVLVVFIVKEVILAIEGLVVYKKVGDAYNSMWYSKVTTLIMYLVLILHIVWRDIPSIVSLISFIITDIFLIVTLIMYTIKNIKIIKGKNLSDNTKMS